MKTVVLDFDGVIHSYSSGWKGEENIPDPPVPGIREAIQNIRASGYRVVVVSTRCRSAYGMGAVRKYLRDNEITVDEVMSEKPPAICYIDDRAICFDGNPETLLEKIDSFKPWNKKRNKSETVDNKALIETIDVALEALHQGPAWSYKIEPLTMEQLLEMDGQPVWIMEAPEWGHWELSEDARDYLTDRDPELYRLTYPDPEGKGGLHELGWIAYAYKPAHIECLSSIENILGDSYDLNRLRELADIKTCDLVEELKKRKGVDVHVVENRSDMFVMAEGPAVVLVVTD